MSSLGSTRIRYVSAKSAATIEQFITSLPFKVELKTIVSQGDRFFCFFVLPEYEGLEFASVDL